MAKHLVDELISVSLSMFRKNFLGIFHGSLSAKIEDEKFIINTRNSIFDELKDDDFIKLYTKKDYRWNEASIDADIHLGIYQNVSDAKYISYTMPPYTTAYALRHDKIVPIDYFGSNSFGDINVYDPKEFSTWYKRAPTEIFQYFQNNNRDIIVVKGYGVYSYDRDLKSLVKKIAILENSCKLLHRNDDTRNSKRS